MTALVPLFSVCDKDFTEYNDVPNGLTYYFNIDFGTYGLGDSFGSHAITINNGRIIIPYGDFDDSDEIKFFEYQAAICAMEFIFSTFGLGSYKIKPVLLVDKINKNFNRNKIKINELIDSEIIFDDPADFATLIFYYHDKIWNNSAGYYIVE